MTNKLRSLFDYQRFAENERLAALISETESRYSHALSDDELEYVSAAGETELPKKRLSGRGNEENDAGGA